MYQARHQSKSEIRRVSVALRSCAIAPLKPITPSPFDADDIDTDTVTRSFRVRFDRNAYSVEPHLLGQHVVVRGNDSHVYVFIGDKGDRPPRCIRSSPRRSK